MKRFDQVNVNREAGTIDIGTGLIWDEVYSILDEQNLTVVGGRLTGIGVAGFSLGGGLYFLRIFASVNSHARLRLFL